MKMNKSELIAYLKNVLEELEMNTNVKHYINTRKTRMINERCQNALKKIEKSNEKE